MPDLPNLSALPDVTGLWEHRKGGVYRGLGVATHSETGEALVVYRSEGLWRLWVRPLAMFLDGRFTKRVPKPTTEWQWFADQYERATPYGSREEAIEEGRDDYEGAFEVYEGATNRIDIAEWYQDGQLLEDIDERLLDNDLHDDDPRETVLTVTPEQSTDLDKRIRQTIREWQEDHALEFKFATIGAMRHREVIANEEVP